LTNHTRHLLAMPLSCVMFVICQSKFEHLKMRKPMALPINVLCDICDLSIKIWAFEDEKTNGDITNNDIKFCVK
jgi:hypothetical protein